MLHGVGVRGQGGGCGGVGLCFGGLFASLLTPTSLPHWRKQSQTLLEGHTGQTRGNRQVADSDSRQRNLLTTRATKHWNKLPRDDAESPSLEIPQT